MIVIRKVNNQLHYSKRFIAIKKEMLLELKLENKWSGFTGNQNLGDTYQSYPCSHVVLKFSIYDLRFKLNSQTQRTTLKYRSIIKPKRTEQFRDNAFDSQLTL
ncbi:hypothetical protein ACOME3_008756 [Neoechinorhynchus agilis]